MDIVPRTKKQTARKSTAPMPRRIQNVQEERVRLPSPFVPSLPRPQIERVSLPPPEIKKRRKSRIREEMLKEMNSKQYAIPIQSFKKFVIQIFKKNFPNSKINFGGLECLHFAAEQYLQKMFLLVGLSAKHRDRKTIDKKDMDFIKTIVEFNENGMKFLFPIPSPTD